jgi:branched-chain amino acid transport system permease protein
MKDKARFTVHIPWIILVLGIIFLPVIIPNPYVISIMIFIALYGVLAVGMGILMGQAGLFSLTHPTWFGLGAYIAGVLAARDIVPPGVGIIIAAACVALTAFIIGEPVLRLRGLYLTIATFGIMIIAQIAFIELGDITGGHSGLLGIPSLSIFGFVFKNDLHYFYLSWGLCLAGLWFCQNIMHSRIGRAIKSSHDSEAAGASVGVNIPKYRLQFFILTAVTASFSGSIFCFYLQFIAPDIFGFHLLVELTLMAVIGGLGTVWAPLLGCFVITWLHEFLKTFLEQLFPIMTGEVTAIFFGMIIILVLIFMPQGLVGLVERLFNLGRKEDDLIEANN